MTKFKEFASSYSTPSLEEQLNKWTNENPRFKIVRWQMFYNNGVSSMMVEYQEERDKEVFW